MSTASSRYSWTGLLREIAMKKAYLFVTALMAVLLSACPECANKMDSSFLLTHLDATYTLDIAPGCNADFTLTGTATPKSGPTGNINVFAAVKGADCSIVSRNGTGAEKIFVKKNPSGRCLITVPFQAATGVHNSFTDVDLRAAVIAQDPSEARCKYTGTAPIVVTTPEENNEHCQLPFSQAGG